MLMSAIVSFGHAEYTLIDKVKVDDIWSPFDVNEDGFGTDEEAVIAFEAHTGLPASNAGDADLAWEHIAVVTGERDDLIEALDKLLEDLAEDPGGDDGTFDYWPSGMRLALQLDSILDADRGDRISQVAADIILRPERLAFADELYDKIRLDRPALTRSLDEALEEFLRTVGDRDPERVLRAAIDVIGATPWGAEFDEHTIDDLTDVIPLRCMACSGPVFIDGGRHPRHGTPDRPDTLLDDDHVAVARR